MKIRVLPSAKADLRRGLRFYEQQEAGLGAYFLDSLSSDIDSLQITAGIHSRRGDQHRCMSARFPYWIYYRIEGHTAFVTAVLDARLEPWKILKRERIEQDAAAGQPPPADPSK